MILSIESKARFIDMLENVDDFFALDKEVRNFIK